MTTPAQPPAPPPATPVLQPLPHSPAAERNAPPILQVLRAWLPASARVLEVASGTGQHAQHFALAQPGWQWQTSEAREAALPALAARLQGLPNAAEPLHLDVLDAACMQAVTRRVAGVDAVFVANLLHIAPWDASAAFFDCAARCLAPAGQVLLYGPFIVEGRALAPSNAAFDADLRQRDGRWGLRHLAAVRQAAALAGLQLVEQRDMPANNLLLRFRPDPTPRG